MTDKTNPAIWKSMTKNNLSIQELLQYSTKNEFDSFNINGIIIDSVQSVNLIRNLFKIDPYAFDMFKSDKEPSELEVIFAALAKENGYIFTKKEIEKYKQKLKGMNIRTASKMFKDISSDKNDIFKNQSSIEKIFDAPNRDFTEFISNNIGIPKIPSEKKLIFLNHIKMQAKKYIKNHSNAELNEFTESLDLYLRANSEYIIQSGQAQQDEISQYIYNNPNVSETDKIIYSIYNLNRLAHNSSELHLKSYLNNKYRNPYIKLDKNIDGKFKNAINGYNILSQYGIKRDIVDALLTGKYDYTNSDTILSTDAISSLNGYVTDGKEFEVLDIDKLKQIYKEYQY